MKKKRSTTKPKNKAAQALARLRDPLNMARSPEMARKAANARWDAHRARIAARAAS